MAKKRHIYRSSSLQRST